MTISYQGGDTNTGNSAAPSTGTHGIPIKSGDLVVVEVHSNNTGTISDNGNGNGSTFILAGTGTAGTNRTTVFWKVANSTEPTQYDFTATSANWRVLIKVFPNAGGMVIDSALVYDAASVSTANFFTIDAAAGRSVANNAVSIIIGGTDDRVAAEDYIVASNGYDSVIGATNTQASAMAHKLWASSGKDVAATIKTADGDDGMPFPNYSWHISFVETFEPTILGPVVIRKSWTKHPPVGRGKPKVDFILSPYVHVQTLGHAPNIGIDNYADQTDASGVAGWTRIDTAKGVGWNSGGTDGPQWARPYLTRAEGFKVLTCGGWFGNANDADDNIIMGVWSSTTGETSWQLELDLNGAAGTALNPRIKISDGTSNTRDLIDTTTDVGDGQLYHIIATMELKANDRVQLKIYVDGVLKGDTETPVDGWQDDINSSFHIGQRQGGDTEDYTGDMIGVFVDRQLWSAQRVASAYRNHWGELFKPQTIFIPEPDELNLVMF